MYLQIPFVGLHIVWGREKQRKDNKPKSLEQRIIPLTVLDSAQVSAQKQFKIIY